MTAPFTEVRPAALALLKAGKPISRKAGSFLGQLVADPLPLTPKQLEWMATLLKRAGLPDIREDAR